MEQRDNIEQTQAYERGGNDYTAGQHLNPFDFEEQGEQARAWVKGYTDCRNNTAALAEFLL